MSLPVCSGWEPCIVRCVRAVRDGGGADIQGEAVAPPARKSSPLRQEGP